MGANNHPTVVPENAGDDGGTETYSKAEALDYLEDAAPHDATLVSSGQYDSFAIEWSGHNRVEVFKHLLANGWAVTSSCDGSLWFERVQGVETEGRY